MVEREVTPAKRRGNAAGPSVEGPGLGRRISSKAQSLEMFSIRLALCRGVPRPAPPIPDWSGRTPCLAKAGHDEFR